MFKFRSLMIPYVSMAMLLTAPVSAQGGAPEDGGFHFSVPPVVAQHPKLHEKLRGEEESARKMFESWLKEDQGKQDKSNYELNVTWKLDAETPAVLVLTSSNYEYTGGAHGMFGTNSLIWDKRRQQSVPFLDLFSDKEAAKAAIMPAYCAMLDAERVGMRGESTARDELFGDCPDPFEGPQPFPVKLNDGHFLRIGFALPPYFAGPYVEGEYAFDIAAPDYITRLLKPEYKDLFQSYM